MKKNSSGSGGGVFSRGESSSSSGSGKPPQKRKLSLNDAVAYLREVKEVFQEDKKEEKLDEFLQVLNDFMAQRIDAPGVIARVKELLKGYSDLILGFNTFLRKGCKIALPWEEEDDEDEQETTRSTVNVVEFAEAIGLLVKIKTRFEGRNNDNNNHNHMYESFVEIVNTYGKENKSIVEVYHEVDVLFKFHPDLVEDFSRFVIPHIAAKERELLLDHVDQRELGTSTTAASHGDDDDNPDHPDIRIRPPPQP